ncbi:hypothetical protein F511_32138 [Dorcoceras hygrometricum]|uniref:Uncharacterized protein n=1 Tax=Dorcoceras hygrometricum TaxID=472368 RepID=A0A2Z7DAL4_9LAMI|nr:hypothetical protein F511_32138 [Dorcoceras hygrometricum]
MSRAMYAGSIGVHPVLMEGPKSKETKQVATLPGKRSDDGRTAAAAAAQRAVQGRAFLPHGSTHIALHNVRRKAARAAQAFLPHGSTHIALHNVRRKAARCCPSAACMVRQKMAHNRADKREASSLWSAAMRGQRAWRLAPTSFTRKPALQTVGGNRSSIRSTTGIKTPSSACTRRPDEFNTDGKSSARWSEQVRRRGGGGGGAWWRPAAAAALGGGRRQRDGEEKREGRRPTRRLGFVCVELCHTTLGSRLSIGVMGLNRPIGPGPGPVQHHLATSPHDPLDITDSACKNQLVVVSVQYGPFNILSRSDQ